MGETDLTVEIEGVEAVVHVRCAIDAHNGPALERLAAGVFSGAPKGVVIDLGECPLLDTSGVRTLIRVRRRADHARIPLRISRCSAPAERVLRRMHLDGVLGLALPAQEGSSYRPSARFHRFAIREPIHVWDGLLHRNGHTLGMSPEGLVIEIPGPLRAFEVLRIEITTPDTGERYRLTGRVALCRTGEPSYAEVEFLSVDPAMRVWLQKQTPSLAAAPPAPPRRTR